MTQSSGKLRTAALAAVASALLALPALATSVVEMNLPTLADHAGQVIVGQVAAVRSYWADSPRRLESEVVFESVDFWKGRLDDSTTAFTLIVPGGTVGDMSMRVADAPVFQVGEQWVLFLLPSYKTYPTVGLSQGAFRVERGADGVARVYDAFRRPVLGFDADDFVHVDRPALTTASSGVPHVSPLRVRGANLRSTTRAITYDDFLAHVRPALERSRRHTLTVPAGLPIQVPYRAVPLRSVAGAAGQRAAPGSAGLRTDAERPAQPKLDAECGRGRP